MASRRIEDLHPESRRKFEEFLKRAKSEGIDVLVYCTYRSEEEQQVLYLQGRLDKFGITLEELNEKRKKLGLWTLSPSEAKRVVTNAKPWQSAHQFGVAIDLVPLHGGKPAWSDVETYKRLGEIAKEFELEWAGEWKRFREMPHFQDSNTWKKMRGR